MKEAILAFLVALVIGAGINGFLNIAPAPPPQQDQVAAKADDGTGAGAGVTAGSSTQQPDMHNVAAVTDQTFDQTVLKSDKPVLVDFYSDNCVPCKQMSPVMAKLADQYAGKLSIVRLNVSENEVTTARYNVASIPTFILFAHGEKGESWSGVVPEGMLTQGMDKVLK